MFPILNPPPLLPPHTHPLGHPSAPAPSIQYCASNLDWQLVSYMILYMFHCYSPKSPHPLPLQREGMGREEGGGFKMGNTGIPVADSFQYLAKLIQYCKV